MKKLFILILLIIGMSLFSQEDDIVFLKKGTVLTYDAYVIKPIKFSTMTAYIMKIEEDNKQKDIKIQLLNDLLIMKDKQISLIAEENKLNLDLKNMYKEEFKQIDALRLQNKVLVILTTTGLGCFLAGAIGVGTYYLVHQINK